MPEYVNWNWPPTPGPDYRCSVCNAPRYLHTDNDQENCPLAGGFATVGFTE
jgi:hypothetical protein